jgi:hypothetical protein
VVFKYVWLTHEMKRQSLYVMNANHLKDPVVVDKIKHIWVAHSRLPFFNKVWRVVGGSSDSIGGFVSRRRTIGIWKKTSFVDSLSKSSRVCKSTRAISASKADWPPVQTG